MRTDARNDAKMFGSGLLTNGKVVERHRVSSCVGPGLSDRGIGNEIANNQYSWATIRYARCFIGL